MSKNMTIARPAATFMVRSSPGEPAIPIRRNALALARRFFQISVAMVADLAAEANLTPLQMGVLAYVNKENGEPGIDQVGLAARPGGGCQKKGGGWPCSAKKGGAEA